MRELFIGERKRASNYGCLLWARLWSASCRLCCKSPFPLLIKNSLGCRCVFRINIWGTSSHSDELTGDFGNEPEAISIGDHGLSRLLAEKLSPHDLGLLQHNLPRADIRRSQ